MNGGVVQVEEIRLGGIVLRFLIDGPTSGGGVTMFEMTVAPGAGMPVPHHHVGFDESGYGVSGRLRFMLEGQSMDAGAGDLVWIERGKVHAAMAAVQTPLLAGRGLPEHSGGETRDETGECGRRSPARGKRHRLDRQSRAHPQD